MLGSALREHNGAVGMVSASQHSHRTVEFFGVGCALAPNEMAGEAVTFAVERLDTGASGDVEVVGRCCDERGAMPGGCRHDINATTTHGHVVGDHPQ